LPEIVGESRGLVPLVTWTRSAPLAKPGTADATLGLLTAPPEISPGGEYNAQEFSAKRQKIRRVIAFRRITDNKLADEGKMEPKIAKMSRDGSKIVFWAPKSGLWTVNPDGTDLKLVRAELPNRRQASPVWLELSPDGKIVYYQVFYSGIFRINSDGTDERPLILRGAGYEPLRLVENGHRLFFSRSDGIYSIDTYGNGDYRAVLTPKKLEKLLDARRLTLGQFSVNELGTRVACAIYHPKLKRKQLFAVNADGTDLRHLAETDFEPTMLTMRPDGSEVVFWKYGQAYAVNWDGSNMRELRLPTWGHNQSAANKLNHFSWDGRWYCFFSKGGPQITQLDGTGRFEPFNTGTWSGFKDAFFNDWYMASYSSDLRKFVFISQYWQNARPRQLIVGEFNPQDTSGLPIISDVEFPSRLSTHPDLPSHIGKLSLKLKEGAMKVERVQFCLSPMVQQLPDSPKVKWSFDRGMYGLKGNRIAGDDGKNGDQTADDGIYTGTLIPHSYYKPRRGRNLLRIIAHTEKDAVIVDVDGVTIK